MRVHGNRMEEAVLREELARSHDAVFRFLRRLCGDGETARDLAQDTMVKAILAIKSFRGESSFRTWLLTIASNLYRDSLRRRKPLPLGDRVDIGDGGRDAEAVERRVDEDRARDLLAGLPLKKRKALALRLELGLSYGEIAAVLGCPVGTVRSRIHEAIGDLREAMGEERNG
jgi:RNA polymerase sigma-70 factor, ECF subfamily